MCSHPQNKLRFKIQCALLEGFVSINVSRCTKPLTFTLYFLTNIIPICKTKYCFTHHEYKQGQICKGKGLYMLYDINMTK